jgi:DNA-binding transcriptional MerR regulator
MAWSTREIAELAGTSLRAVRHYHDIGLLEEPERHANGYKRYGVAHLVRVLRIKRLTDLGFSLQQVSAMGDTDDHPEQALSTLDAELAATIDRLQRVRVELSSIRRQAVLSDLPPEIASAAAGADLSDTERSFVVVLSRVLGPEGLGAYAEMLQKLPPNPNAAEFYDLAADADERTRQGVAERLVPYARLLRAEHPELSTLNDDAPHGARFVEQTVGEAMNDLYNPAQLDVVRRTESLLRAEPSSGTR